MQSRTQYTAGFPVEEKGFNYSAPNCGVRNFDGSANIPDYTEDDAARQRAELAQRVKEELGI